MSPLRTRCWRGRSSGRRSSPPRRRSRRQSPPRSLSGEAFGKLLAYNWPGNIRELENVLENAVALSESELIYAEHIHLEGTAPAPLTLKERLKREERQILRQTLAQCGGSRVKAMERWACPRPCFTAS